MGFDEIFEILPLKAGVNKIQGLCIDGLGFLSFFFFFFTRIRAGGGYYRLSFVPQYLLCFHGFIKSVSTLINKMKVCLLSFSLYTGPVLFSILMQ